MGMRELEAQILAELRAVTGIAKIRQKDICEWSSALLKNTPADETIVTLPSIGIYVSYLIPPTKAQIAKAARNAAAAAALVTSYSTKGQV